MGIDISCSSLLNLCSSNRSIHAVALADKNWIYCALLVPTPLILDLKDGVFVSLRPSITDVKTISVNVRPLVTVRPLVSSIAFSFALGSPLTTSLSPSISLKNIKTGLTISVAVLPNGFNIDHSSTLLMSTLVGADSYLSSEYLNFYSNSKYNHLIFTDQRMNPQASSQIASACKAHPNSRVTILPIVAPYYHIIDFRTAINHEKPADAGLIKQQQDYYFVLLPLICMLSQLISISNKMKYLTFVDMDERQIHSDALASYLSSANSSNHLLCEEINVYAESAANRNSINRFMSSDIIFPNGRVLRNRKAIYNCKNNSYALDSPHGVVDNYDNYQILPLHEALYLHFFNITQYKRITFSDCLKKVDKRKNFLFSQLNNALLLDYKLQLLDDKFIKE